MTEQSGTSLIAVVLEENARLKTENGVLHQQLDELRQENQRLLGEEIGTLKEALQASKQEREREYEQFQQENEKLRKENEGLRKEIDELREEMRKLRNEKEEIERKNGELEQKVDTLTAKMERFENEREKERLLLLAYDLSSLFIHYAVFPDHQDWNRFTSELSEKCADVEDKSITQKKFDTWLQSYPFPHLLLPIQKITTSRHQVAHTDLRSAVSQTRFLSSLQKEAWDILPKDHVSSIREMIFELQGKTLKRWPR